MTGNSSPDPLNKRILELEKETSRLRQIEKALSESEEKYRRLIEEIDLGITMIDINYNIIISYQQQQPNNQLKHINNQI